MWKQLRASTIAKKHATLMLLVVSGAMVGLYSFYRYGQQAALQGARSELARDQVDLVERMPIMAELIIRGSTDQREALTRRIRRFERSVDTFEHGRGAQPNRTPLPRVEGEARTRLLAVKEAWPPVRAALLTIISGSPAEQAAAYDDLRAAQPQLEASTENFLNTELATFADLRAEVFGTLQLIALVDGLLFVLALGLSHRFIGRPLRLIEDATHKITAGEFGVQVPIVTSDELASLGQSFNAMSTKLAQLLEVEKQFVRAQKMEVVGQLASGAAHDFNNLLLGIIGHAEFAAEQIPRDSAAHEDLRQILALSQHGADLNRQLLVFSRQQPIARRPLDLNREAARTVETLRRTIGEDVTLVFTPGPIRHLVSADPTHLDQVLMNLAINARDAMPKGGALTIETREVLVSVDSQTMPQFVRPGSYVALSVRDAGCGMDPETLRHVFEPFFTTKEVGKGTGLGLASAYAIVKQHDGYIFIDSAIGRGTTVTTYWPKTEIIAAVNTPDRETCAKGGSERLLLVEDQAPIRTLVTRSLERLGYQVTGVESAAQAELHIARHGFNFDLLLTDVVMPGIGGPDLYLRLVQRHPGLKVLFMSGAVDRATRDGALVAGRLLLKPFNGKGLSEAVRAALNDGVPPKANHADGDAGTRTESFQSEFVCQ